MALRLLVVLACTFFLSASRELPASGDGYDSAQALLHGELKLDGNPLVNVIALLPEVVCRHSASALFMAAAGVVFFLLTQRRGASPRLGALLTLGAALSTSLWSAARVPGAEALQTFLLLLLVREIFCVVEKFSVARLGLAVVLCALLWNSMQPTTAFFANRGALWPGLYGSLFSSGKSIFLYSPPLLLLFFALRPAWQHQRRETAILVAVIAIVLLWNAKLRDWHGGAFWGPRHLVPVVPLALLLLVPWLSSAREGMQRHAVGVLFALGFFVQLLGATLHGGHYFRVLAALRNQTGATGWFQEQGGPAYYMPQFSPLRGQLWLLSHKLRGDANLFHDAPWKLILPQPVDLGAQYQALRYDFWLIDRRSGLSGLTARTAQQAE